MSRIEQALKRAAALRGSESGIRVTVATRVTGHDYAETAAAEATRVEWFPAESGGEPASYRPQTRVETPGLSRRSIADGKVPGSAGARRGVGRPSEDATNEAATLLARDLFLADEARSIRRVLFTSVDESQGSADVAIRIADALAQQASRPVYLLDMDLNHPSFDGRFDLQGQIGFSDAVMEGGDLRGYAHQASSGSKLWVMPAGLQTAKLRPVVADAGTHRRIAALISTLDYVIAHTAAIGQYPDAELIGSLFDGVVLVVHANTTTAEATRRAANAVKASKAQLLGTVLDNRAPSAPT